MHGLTGIGDEIEESLFQLAAVGANFRKLPGKLSDHLDASFGESFGVLIKELRLLARAVFVVDRGGIIQYIQLVKEVADEPDYDSVLDAVTKLV